MSVLRLEQIMAVEGGGDDRDGWGHVGFEPNNRPSIARGGLNFFGDEAADGIDMTAEAAGTNVPHPHLAPVVLGADVQYRGGVIDLAFVRPVGLIHYDLARTHTFSHHRDMTAYQPHVA